MLSTQSWPARFAIHRVSYTPDSVPSKPIALILLRRTWDKPRHGLNHNIARRAEY